MQAGQLAPGGGEGGEIRREGNARQLALEVIGELLAVGRMVQDGVDVVEDVPLGDGRIAVVVPEFLQGGIGDILAAIGAVGGVGERFSKRRASVADARTRGSAPPFPPDSRVGED
jgi:hypothetical protein